MKKRFSASAYFVYSENNGELNFLSQESDINYYVSEASSKFPNDLFRIVICHKNEVDFIQSDYKQIIDNTFLDNGYCISKSFEVCQLQEVISFLKFKFVTIIRQKVNNEKMSENIQDAFISNLKGQVSNLTELRAAVEYISEKNMDSIIVRSMHLVQSSGYGKTKHGIELIRDCGQGLYFVIRDPRSSGFPGQPTWVASLMKVMRDSINHDDCEFYWLLMVKMALETFNFEKMQDINLVQLFSGIKNKNNNDILNSFSSQIDSFNIIKTFNYVTLVNEIISLAANIGISTGEKLFPLIFDEASELLECPNPGFIEHYRSLRRVLTRLVSIKGIVAIFMGTSSLIKDYHYFFKDDSTRNTLKVLGEKKEIFRARPFVLAHSVDVFSQVIELDYASIIENPKEFQENLIHFGRPLWSGYKDWEGAKSLARTKLEMFDEHDAPLNALLVRICAAVSPQGTFASRLVQSGMATLLFVDEKGEDCYSTYVAEPVLSNAARELLSETARFLKAVELLTSYVGRGFFQKGQSGELVSRIILLLAMDKGGNSYKKLKVFLEDLAGGAFSLNEKFPDELLDGILNFSQFISMDAIGFTSTGKEIKFRITQDLLKEAFVRNVALILPVGAKGADMIIPILKPDNTMSCISIQVKNLANLNFIGGKHLKTVLHKLSPSFLSFLDLSLPISTTPPSSPVTESATISIAPPPERITRSKSTSSKSSAKNSIFTYLPLMIQLSPSLPSDGIKVENVRIQSYKGNNFICMLGLSAFDHLFNNGAIVAKNHLQALINGEFHFINHIENDRENFIPAQSQKAAFESRLFTTNPVANKGYLAFSNENYRKINKKEADLIDEKLKASGIERRRSSSGHIIKIKPNE